MKARAPAWSSSSTSWSGTQGSGRSLGRLAALVVMGKRGQGTCTRCVSATTGEPTARRATAAAHGASKGGGFFSREGGAIIPRLFQRRYANETTVHTSP